MAEIWKDVVGYEGIYEVSNLGEVRTVTHITDGRCWKAKKRKPYFNPKNGYLVIALSKNGKLKNEYVHRMVAMAFIKNPEGKATVNHKNENKTDNRAENLEWMTLPENLSYGTRNERSRLHHHHISGEQHSNYGKRGAEACSSKGKVIGVSIHDGSIVEFDSAITACRTLGIRGIYAVLNGRQETSGGYRWRRANE